MSKKKTDFEPLTKALVLKDAHMEEPAYYELAGMQAALYSRRSPDKESVNEDSLTLIPVADYGWVALVADGAGGQRGGSQASQIVVDAVTQSVSRTDPQDLRNAVLDGIEQANKQIIKLGLGAGSTLALLEARGRSVRPYHIGDSEIMVVGQRGKLKLQTVAHSPASYAVEAGVLEQEEALQHEDRHLVSNLMGFEDMRIELGPVLKLADRDTVIIACDGLFDNFPKDEVGKMIRNGDLATIMNNLINMTQERMQSDGDGKADDLSIILLRPQN